MRVLAAGASFADVVKITTYVGTMSRSTRHCRHRRVRHLRRRAPQRAPSSVSPRSALPEWLVEIEAVAVVD